MPFIKGYWVEPEKKSTEKKKIRSSQVNLRFLHGRPVGKTYRIVQEVILANGQVFNPKPIQMKDIDRKSFYKEIMLKLHPQDREYMKLVSFSTNKAVFDFDYEKWFNDSLKNVNPNNRISKFEQRFVFKKQVPRMISYSMKTGFDDFMIRKFKEYMSKQRKNRTWFLKFLPREISGSMRNKVSTMFNYEYDWQSNTVVAKLKDVYMMGILFAVGNTIENKTKGKKLIGIDFEKSVRRKAKQFDRRKWETFIKKRFI